MESEVTQAVLTSLFSLSLRNAKLREQAVEVVRDLISSHDSDCRYSNPEVRSRIASIYLPLLSIVMDNFQCLYKVTITTFITAAITAVLLSCRVLMDGTTSLTRLIGTLL